jgi:hypothetical protein
MSDGNRQIYNALAARAAWRDAVVRQKPIGPRRTLAALLMALLARLEGWAR